MKNKSIIRVSIKGVSDQDYVDYKTILELNMRTIFSHIEEKSKVDPDFKNGELYVWPLLIQDLHYRTGFEPGILYKMKDGKIIVILGFETGGGILGMQCREYEEVGDRIERLKTIAADIFRGLVDGLSKKGVGIEGDVHMSFDSYPFSIQEEVSSDFRQG